MLGLGGRWQRPPGHECQPGAGAEKRGIQASFEGECRFVCLGRSRTGLLLERCVATDRGGATGRVYQLSATQLSDDGAAIPSYYTTHYFPERAVEQTLNLGAHRKLFSYLTMYVEGAGSLSLTSFVNSVSAPQAQQALPLSSPAAKDLELPINVLGERVAFQVSTNQSGAWFRLQKFTPSLRPDPWAPVRGLN